jgi:hypothetical protein
VLLFVLAEHTETSFSWNIEPPLSAAYLGAAYWAACVLIAWSATQRTWDRARATVPPVLVIAVLLLGATLIHLDRFDFDSVFGWFLLAAYLLVPPGVIVLVALQLRAPGADGDPGGPLPPGLRHVLGLQAGVMMVLGAALCTAPAQVDSVWPWTLTPLTARAIGAFLCGFGVAAAHAVVEDDRVRFRGAALAYLALGVLELLAVAVYGGDLSGGAGRTALYTLFLASVVLVGLWGVAVTRSGPRAP